MAVAVVSGDRPPHQIEIGVGLVVDLEPLAVGIGDLGWVGQELRDAQGVHGDEVLVHQAVAVLVHQVLVGLAVLGEASGVLVVAVVAAHLERLVSVAVLVGVGAGGHQDARGPAVGAELDGGLGAPVALGHVDQVEAHGLSGPQGDLLGEVRDEVRVPALLPGHGELEVLAAVVTVVGDADRLGEALPEQGARERHGLVAHRQDGAVVFDGIALGALVGLGGGGLVSTAGSEQDDESQGHTRHGAPGELEMGQCSCW